MVHEDYTVLTPKWLGGAPSVEGCIFTVKLVCYQHDYIVACRVSNYSRGFLYVPRE